MNGEKMLKDFDKNEKKKCAPTIATTREIHSSS